MRRLPPLAAALVLPLLGCRPPAIPAQPSPGEYAIYNAWLEQTSSTLPPSLTLAVDDATLAPRQNELQFQQCLPPRMEDIFDKVPPTTLTSTSGNEWLKLGDGRSTHLRPANSPLHFDHPTDWVRLSRVAFTLSGYDAYLWVEHSTCGTHDKGCSEGSGTLIHGKKSSGSWTFEDTTCQILLSPTPPQV